MAKKDEGPEPGTEIVDLKSPGALLQMIDTNVVAVPTERLFPFYVAADSAEKQLAKLKKKVRDEMIKSRRDEGEKSGEDNEHRVFTSGRYQLTIQERKSWPLNQEKATALIRSKKKEDLATSVTVTCTENPYTFAKFLQKNRAELKKLGVEFEVEVTADGDKMAALVVAKVFTQKELEACLDKNDPTYALVPKVLKEDEAKEKEAQRSREAKS